MPQPPPDSLRQTVDSLRGTSDSLQHAADSLRADLDSLADSTSVLVRAARDVGDASDLIVRGRWDMFLAKMGEMLDQIVVGFLPMLVRALVVGVLLYLFYRGVSFVLGGVLRRSDRVDEGLRNLTLRSLRVLALLLGGVVVLAQFGIDATVLVGGLSIAGLALGFAARDTLENFISGIAILLDRPFRVGDQVHVADTYGTVVDISLRSTRLRTLNNEILVMPNVQMITQKLLNHAMLGAVRVSVPFGVAYHESPGEVRERLLALFGDDDRIASQPPPHVVVTELADSSVNMELRFFLTDTSLEVPVRAEYLERVFHALREADISIPFPQLDLHLAPGGSIARAVAPTSATPGVPTSGEAALPLVVVAGARQTPGGEELARNLEAEGIDAEPGTDATDAERSDGDAPEGPPKSAS